MSQEDTVQQGTGDVDVNEIVETREQIQEDVAAAASDHSSSFTTGYVTAVDADGQGGLELVVRSDWGEHAATIPVADESRQSGISEAAEAVETALDGDVLRPDTFIGEEVHVVQNRKSEGTSLVLPTRYSAWLLNRKWTHIDTESIYYADGVAALVMLASSFVFGLCSIALGVSVFFSVVAGLVGGFVSFVLVTALLSGLLSTAATFEAELME